ncbi:MAG: hypothetical protein JWR10_2606 [Rubritepida sp.]|nr:hypothetical protein [Rubritepida sp.]
MMLKSNSIFAMALLLGGCAVVAPQSVDPSAAPSGLESAATADQVINTRCQAIPNRPTDCTLQLAPNETVVLRRNFRAGTGDGTFVLLMSKEQTANEAVGRGLQQLFGELQVYQPETIVNFIKSGGAEQARVRNSNVLATGSCVSPQNAEQLNAGPESRYPGGLCTFMVTKRIR